MSTVKLRYPFIISDACDETGRGCFEARVNQTQLEYLLSHDMIYEDTASDYVEDSERRHFHPMHENTSMGEIVALLDIDTGEMTRE